MEEKVKGSKRYRVLKSTFLQHLMHTAFSFFPFPFDLTCTPEARESNMR